MAGIIQFVNSIAASPTVRLDLNSMTSGLMVAESGIDFSPPPLRSAVAGTLLTDGERIPASAYGNREIRLPLRIVAQTTDAAATVLQNLTRELDRPQNILKVQLHGASSPVFFRTFRTDYEFSMLRLLLTQRAVATVGLRAEPFAYGLLETPISAVTVSTDPAAATNPCYVDVTGVKGDVEAPAIIRWPASGMSVNDEMVLAVRRRGTPSQSPFLFQAESLTQGTDTTTQVNSASFSGGGNNYSRCTFTTATMQTRLSTIDIGTASVDLRGTYRVFLRYRKNTSTDAINLFLRWGSSLQDIDNDVYATPNTTNITMADLGLISIPVGVDPVQDPLGGGVELVVSDTWKLQLRAERTSGAGTIDFDYLILIPSDDRFCIVKWSSDSTEANHWIIDANGTVAHARNASSQVVGALAPAIAGGLPMLTPNQTNRVYLFRNLNPGDPTLLTTDSPVSVSYYPRYLSVRPAST